MNNAYCSMIHGGLLLYIGSSISMSPCCLLPSGHIISDTELEWDHTYLTKIREINKTENWYSDCINICQRLENAGLQSFRLGMNDGLGIKGVYNTLGPYRLDLSLTNNCNLACRTCGPVSSSFWHTHLLQHNVKSNFVPKVNKVNDAIKLLKNIDLSNLKQVVYCGGETLLGNDWWEITSWLIDNVPNASNQLMIGFQTNGTQPIRDRYYRLIEKCNLVKLHISLDGIGPRFEYLRWPAKWDQVVDNILTIKNTAPSNVMFVIEETISIFNLYYKNELQQWVEENFSSNREGDIINHTAHFAKGIFSLDNLTQQYVDQLDNTSFVPLNWKENPTNINTMLQTIKQFDSFRDESFVKTFPEVAEFYSDYL